MDEARKDPESDIIHGFFQLDWSTKKAERAGKAESARHALAEVDETPKRFTSRPYFTP